MALENDIPSDNLDKEFQKLSRQYKKLERDYRALAVMHEQTERLRNANEAAKELSSFYNRLLLKNNPGRVYMLDLELRCMLANDLTVNRLGYAVMGEIVGMPFAQAFGRVFPDWCVERLTQNCKQVIANLQDLNFELAVTLNHGQYIVYQVTITPAQEASGTCQGVVIVMNDITELSVAREAAEQASRAKSDFLSNMSHEMRTPMNAIIGMTSIARSSDDIEKKEYCLKKIEQASKHLLGVINDILDMSKIEAKKFTLSAVEFDFERLLQKVVTVNNYRMEEKSQEFILTTDRAIPRQLYGDDQRLSQVITNLLSNAVKFTPEKGAIYLNATLVTKTQTDCLLEFRVIDSGIGISEEQQTRLFTSFEQADSGITRKFGGTGLGLAISKQIVAMMGGEIHVESELDKGSTFVFTVQLELGKELPRNPLNPAVDWSTFRTLLVDDAPEVREYFQSVAQELGIAGDVAADAYEALDLTRANGDYDVYFVDWRLPGMDGIELSRKLKEQSVKECSIIMVTGADWTSIEAEAKAAGVDKYLQKPFFTEEIAEAINKSMALEVDERGAAAAGSETEGSFEGHTVLLAEDMEVNREIVLAILEPTGLEIVCVENGLEALNIFESDPQRFDMIFMDVQMPVMGGLEATRTIRALGTPAALDIPIIAMTANVFREDVEQCLAAGMNGHVGKPIDFDEVFEKLKTYLKD
jgi:signal transduction histidine kinase/DNA-binding response OmpR family regulator